MFVRVPTPTYEFIVGTGAKATTPRREIADTGQCLKCHVGSLYQHGNTRVDNVTMCIICHNSASSDQNNRVLMGVDKSEAYDGKVGQTYELKTMLHAIHSAGTGLAPYVDLSDPRHLCLGGRRGDPPELAALRAVTPADTGIGLRWRSSGAAGRRSRTTCTTRPIRGCGTTARPATWTAST